MCPALTNAPLRRLPPVSGSSQPPRGLQTTGQSRPTRALCTLLPQPQRLPSDRDKEITQPVLQPTKASKRVNLCVFTISA